MSQYKVLQDIEAEDKLLGPLTLRQFIYAILVVVMGFFSYRLASVAWYLALPLLPPIVFFGLLAAPFGREQSTEVWLLAKIRFFIFPRRRIWDQTGVQDLVTITAPKVIEKNVTNGLDQKEVKSRLKALASTMDTRGWAVKNVTTGFASPVQATDSDRLLQLEEVPQADLSVKPSEDVLDPTGNPLAQTMSSMVDQSQQTHRQAILQKMHDLAEQQKAQAQVAAPAAPAPAKAYPKIGPASQATVQMPEPPAPRFVSSVPANVLPPNDQSQQAQAPMTGPAPTAIIDGVDNQSSPSELSIHGTDDDTDGGEVVVSLH